MWSLWTKLLDIIAPRTCAQCGARLAPTEEGVCLGCLLELPRTEHWRQPYDNPVAHLFWGRLDIEKAAAYFHYVSGSEAARIIHAMKYYGRYDLGETLGRVAAREFAAEGFFRDIDIIVPVPLARNRRRHRGYNQSEEIARGVAQTTGLPMETKAIKRKKYRKSQTSLSRLERLENVEGIFTLASAERLEGKHVLIIDDVVTTGATIIACASQLAAIPGIKISVMALATARH